MKFHAVGDLGEVLAIALRGASLHEGRIMFAEPTAAPVPKAAAPDAPATQPGAGVTEIDL
jgi:hypothetical protein